MTSTSSFGASRREAHDASAFYRRGLAAAAFSGEEELAEVPSKALDRVYLHSAEAMAELPENSVGLMVASPPYLSACTCLTSIGCRTAADPSRLHCIIW